MHYASCDCDVTMPALRGLRGVCGFLTAADMSRHNGEVGGEAGEEVGGVLRSAAACPGQPGRRRRAAASARRCCRLIEQTWRR